MNYTNAGLQTYFVAYVGTYKIKLTLPQLIGHYFMEKIERFSAIEEKVY